MGSDIVNEGANITAGSSSNNSTPNYNTSTSSGAYKARTHLRQQQHEQLLTPNLSEQKHHEQHFYSTERDVNPLLSAAAQHFAVDRTAWANAAAYAAALFASRMQNQQQIHQGALNLAIYQNFPFLEYARGINSANRMFFSLI